MATEEAPKTPEGGDEGGGNAEGAPENEAE